ncbi:MAG: transposase [Thaumarchaeota archaeon]|nr:transposase [Nitrososphaerota archaeon]
MRATKCVTQSHSSELLANLLAECLSMTCSAINYAKEHGIDNRRGMKRFYQTLKAIRLPSCYKVASITRACAVLKSRKKSERRGVTVRHPRPLRPGVCIVSGFFITMKGRLFIPLRRGEYFDTQLNSYTLKELAKREVRSLTITPDSLSFCYSEDIEAIPVTRVYGVDRNEKNITFGDRETVTRVEMMKAVKIRQTTRQIVASFKRNDVRIRRKLARKYWRRADHRTDQILHAATNFIVGSASKDGAALAIEDLAGIRRMYRRGSGQGADYRFRLNSWPHWRAKKLLEYKAAWKGVTVLPLTKSEAYGSSSECSACGEKLRGPVKGDAGHARMLWCQRCKVWIDRDVNAALNLSARGRSRFDRSLPSRPETKEESRSQQAATSIGPTEKEKGRAGEAMTGNGTTTLVLRVDASKLTHRREPKS